MDGYTIQRIAALIAALAGAAVVFNLLRTVKIERGAAARVNRMIETERISPFDRYGERYIKARPVSLADNLRLAQLGGKYPGWTVQGVIVRSIVYGGAALLYMLLMRPGPLFWIAVPLAAYYPIMRVRGAADETRQVVNRMLPETATVIAAEMAAGASPEQALTRASELPGAVGLILRSAVAAARRQARPAFSRGTAQGVVMEALAEYNLPTLNRFAAQLDRVAGKGVEGPRVMGEVARGFARDYKAQVQMAAASLDNKLLFPMTAFFFFPFMVAILLPLLLALFSAF